MSPNTVRVAFEPTLMIASLLFHRLRLASTEPNVKDEFAFYSIVPEPSPDRLSFQKPLEGKIVTLLPSFT